MEGDSLPSSAAKAKILGSVEAPELSPREKGPKKAPPSLCACAVPVASDTGDTKMTSTHFSSHD
jgi:hypothetical protein